MIVIRGHSSILQLLYGREGGSIPYRAAFHLAPWSLAIASIVSIAVVLFWNLIWRQLTKPNDRVVYHFIFGDSTVESSCLNWEKYKVW